MYRLSSEQHAIVEKARQVAVEQIAPHAAQVDEHGEFPRRSIDALGAEGYLGLMVPTELGGMGQGMRVACAVLDEIAQCCASTAMIYLMHLCGVANYLNAPQPPRDLLRAAAEGKHLSTLAWSERGSRSHFWAPVSKPTRQDGSIMLDADKSFVTSAGEADGYSISTLWWDAEQPLQSVLYVALRDDPGLSVSGEWSGMGMRGNASAPMTLRNVILADDRLLSEPGKGFDGMLALLPVFQLGNAAVQVGIAEAAVQATLQHVTSARLEHLDQRLCDSPIVRDRLAQMRIETDRGRAHLVATIEAVEQPGPTTMLLVLESKAAAAETSMRVTDLAMRTAGGAAYGRRLSLDRHFRDARAAGVMAATTDALHDFIGRALCGMELF